MRPTQQALAIVAAMALGLLPQTSAAVDGVVEINQTSALFGGITPSDLPGFPVTLDQPGSYRLTGNLDLSGEPIPGNVNAVEIKADDVSLDLNGFSITGTTSCSTDPAGPTA